MMPMALFEMSTTPNSPSALEPTARTATRSAPRMALKRVRTLARTIAESERLVCCGTRFVWPAAVRSATSSVPRPV